jgi:hypothetical protein
VTVDFARGSRRSLSQSGHQRGRQQPEPENESAFHVLLLESSANSLARELENRSISVRQSSPGVLSGVAACAKHLPAGHVFAFKKLPSYCLP